MPTDRDCLDGSDGSDGLDCLNSLYGLDYEQKCDLDNNQDNDRRSD